MAKLNEHFAYAYVGQKCFFCKDVFTLKDSMTKDKIWFSQLDHATHKECIEYIMKKYPKMPMAELEGKIERRRVY